MGKFIIEKELFYFVGGIECDCEEGEVCGVDTGEATGLAERRGFEF